MTVSSVDMESEFTYAAALAMKVELETILKPFAAYSNTGVTRQHAENMAKTWLSYKHKRGLVRDYSVRCDVFDNVPMIYGNPEKVVEDNVMVIDVAFQIHFPKGMAKKTPAERDDDDSYSPFDFSTHSPFIFIPISINFEHGPEEFDNPGNA